MNFRACSFVLMAAVTGCMGHEEAPARAPHDARGGYAPSQVDRTLACKDWSRAIRGDAYALQHVSFPELDRSRACYTNVHYDGETATPDAPPQGCGYRPDDAANAIRAEAERDERIARGDYTSLPLELACDLPDPVRRAAAANNARTLRAILGDAGHATYAYATIEAFGYGNYAHEGTPLDRWMPGEACPSLVDLRRFGVNVDRAARAALAWAGGVAPLVVVSGGAVHSKLVEAFLLDYIATCRLGVPSTRVLVDPCARHTHTNILDSARLLLGIGGRVAYIVTDDALQAKYLEDWSAFTLVGGSLDQRSLRDYGHLLGSWRRASVGIEAGFWFTPYRFWADSRLANFSCDN